MCKDSRIGTEAGPVMTSRCFRFRILGGPMKNEALAPELEPVVVKGLFEVLRINYLYRLKYF